MHKNLRVVIKNGYVQRLYIYIYMIPPFGDAAAHDDDDDEDDDNIDDKRWS